MTGKQFLSGSPLQEILYGRLAGERKGAGNDSETWYFSGSNYDRGFRSGDMRRLWTGSGAVCVDLVDYSAGGNCTTGGIVPLPDVFVFQDYAVLSGVGRNLLHWPADLAAGVAERSGKMAGDFACPPDVVRDRLCSVYDRKSCGGKKKEVTAGANF